MFDDNFRYSFPFCYINLGPLEDTVSKDGILSCRLPLLLRESAGDGKYFTVSAFIQACMIGKRRRAYVFFYIDDVKVLRKAV